MKNTIKLFPALDVILLITILLISCSKDDVVSKSKEAKLISFSFKKQYNPELAQDYIGTIDEANKKINIALPEFTNINNLVASFVVSDKAILKINGINQQNNTTYNNFESGINYVVEAEDGTKITYAITVTVPLSDKANIISFSFKKDFNPELTQDYVGTIDEAAKKINITLPAFTKTNNLVSSFVLTSRASMNINGTIQQNNTTSNDFASSLNYNLVAQNGVTITYTITVNVLLSDETSIVSYTFSKGNNTVITKDILGYITKDDKGIVLRNPYLTKKSFVPTFVLSPGATMKINGVTQISGVTSVNFLNEVIAEVIAQSGKINVCKIKITSNIVNYEDFIKECPMSDPNISQILSDFQIRIDGNIITSFPCTNPYYPMSTSQFTDEEKALQTLRILFYLDIGQSNHLPWTNLRIYDWLKSKIGGINIQTGLNGGYCCTTYNGKPFITIGALKNNSFGNYAQIPDLYSAWSMHNIVLLLHEVRHLDGYSHTNCCPSGAGVCDNKYDLADLSPYGMHVWWNKAILNRQFEFGFDCMSSTMKSAIIEGAWSSIDRQKANFCTSPVNPVKPSVWDDCNYK